MLCNNFVSTDGAIVPGENIEFAVKCTRCGHDAFITTNKFFSLSDKENPSAITLNFKCVCGNDFYAVIHNREANS